MSGQEGAAIGGPASCALLGQELLQQAVLSCSIANVLANVTPLYCCRVQVGGDISMYWYMSGSIMNRLGESHWCALRPLNDIALAVLSLGMAAGPGASSLPMSGERSFTLNPLPATVRAGRGSQSGAKHSSSSSTGELTLLRWAGLLVLNWCCHWCNCDRTNRSPGSSAWWQWSCVL